jgi:hypothetical protein
MLNFYAFLWAEQKRRGGRGDGRIGPAFSSCDVIQLNPFSSVTSKPVILTVKERS